MKVLLDTCVFGGAVEVLRAAGYEVSWSGTWERDPGDEQLLSLAFREGQVVVTLDKDFGELAVVRGTRHCGIVRLVGFRAEEQGTAARGALEKYRPRAGGRSDRHGRTNSRARTAERSILIVSARARGLAPGWPR